MKEMGQYLAGYDAGKADALAGKDWAEFEPGTNPYYTDGYRKGYLEN